MLNSADLPCRREYSGSYNGKVEAASSAKDLKQTEWSKPGFTLPTPGLAFLFHLECDMESFHVVGDGPHGNRSTVIFKGQPKQ